MTRISKEITNVLIETGISMLKIVKDLNEKDQLFPPEQLKIEKGKKDVDTKPDVAKDINTPA